MGSNETRRFAPPWRVEEENAETFVVIDLTERRSRGFIIARPRHANGHGADAAEADRDAAMLIEAAVEERSFHCTDENREITQTCPPRALPSEGGGDALSFGEPLPPNLREEFHGLRLVE